jgi:alpha-glucosidase/alpha-D-xyloside xylohydrolase
VNSCKNSKEVKMNSYTIGGKSVKLCFNTVGENVLRMSVLPSGQAVQRVFTTLDLADKEWGEPDIVFTGGPEPRHVEAGFFTVKMKGMEIEVFKGQKKIQKLSVCQKTGNVKFDLRQGEKIYGLGQGYRSHLDRRGTRYDLSLHGQLAGYIENFSALSPVAYIIGNGWALFFHQPWKGTLDLTGDEGVFEKDEHEYCDVFIFHIDKPSDSAVEYYALTGLPPLPPKYAFGYMQSYRTLKYRGEEEVMKTARYMRENDLPCDILVYLGTGYCDNGWNTYNGKFAWHPDVFPDPKKAMEELHKMHYKISLHVTRCPASLHGTLGRNPELSPLEYDHVENYWQKHRELYATAKNEAWWPDDGDEIDVVARLTRQRLYYEGSLELEPDRRPFYLNRNSSPGHTKWGGVIWSGDVMSEWETLKNHVPLGLNVGVSSTPYWSSDTGGFYCSKEYSGELYVRWFEYNTFTPFLRSHGRQSYLHTPWGWKNIRKVDDMPNEITDHFGRQGLPAEDALGDERVEPICRKFIHERYKLLPYIYTLAWEASMIGLPMMRPLWIVYPEDPNAGDVGTEYMLGQSLLVSPVTAKGVTEWPVYFPAGKWYDYWTKGEYEGGKTVKVPAGLDTIPVFIPAGGILVQAPVAPYVDIEPKKGFGEISIEVYTGADGTYRLYEDDGISLGYMRGENIITDIFWEDKSGKLNGRGTSALMSGKTREIEVTLYPSKEKRSLKILYE